MKPRTENRSERDDPDSGLVSLLWLVVLALGGVDLVLALVSTLERAAP